MGPSPEVAHLRSTCLRQVCSCLGDKGWCESRSSGAGPLPLHSPAWEMAFPALADLPPGAESPLPAGPRGPHPPSLPCGSTHPLALRAPIATMTRAQKQLAPTPASTTSRAMRASRLRPRLHSQYVPAAETGPVWPRGPRHQPVEGPRGRPSPREGPWLGQGSGTGGSTCSRDEQKGQTHQAKGAASQAGVRLGTGRHVQPPAHHTPLDGTHRKALTSQ